MLLIQKDKAGIRGPALHIGISKHIPSLERDRIQNTQAPETRVHALELLHQLAQIMVGHPALWMPRRSRLEPVLDYLLGLGRQRGILQFPNHTHIIRAIPFHLDLVKRCPHLLTDVLLILIR